MQHVLNATEPPNHHVTRESKWEGGGSSSGPGTRAVRKVSNLWLWGLQGFSSTLLLHSNLPPFRCAVGTAGLPGLNLPVLTRGPAEELHEPLADLIRVLGVLRPLWNWIYINMINCGCRQWICSCLTELAEVTMAAECTEGLATQESAADKLSETHPKQTLDFLLCFHFVPEWLLLQMLHSCWFSRLTCTERLP